MNNSYLPGHLAQALAQAQVNPYGSQNSSNFYNPFQSNSGLVNELNTQRSGLWDSPEYQEWLANRESKKK